MRHAATLALWSAAFTCLQGATASAPVKLSLETIWPEADFLPQALETLSIETPEAFFLALDALSVNNSHNLSRGSPQDRYNAFISFLGEAGLLSAPGELDSFKFALALKESNPVLEAFADWYRALEVPATTEPQNTCDSWIHFDGRRLCSPAEFEEALGAKTQQNVNTPEILSIDHVFPSTDLDLAAPTAVLYAAPDPSSFGPLHLRLSQKSGQIRYIFRWVPSGSGNGRLGGWGAALDIKKADYLVVDDRPVDVAESSAVGNGSLQSQSSTINPLLNEENGDSVYAEFIAASSRADVLTALKASEFDFIGIKAAQFIVLSPEPFKVLRLLSQDFPKYAHTLATRWVPHEAIEAELDAELLDNSMTKFEAGRSAVWVNGLQLSPSDLDPYSMARVFRRERKLINSLLRHGLDVSQARRLMSHKALNDGASKGRPGRDGKITIEALGDLFDASDVREGGGVITWWNDLERDKRYRGWSQSLREILRPTYPGQLNMVARNTINVILALDMTQTSSFVTIAKVIAPLIQRQLPIRWGTVPIVSSENDKQVEAASLLHSLIENGGRSVAMDVISEFAASAPPGVDIESLRARVVAAIASRKEEPIPINADEMAALLGVGPDKAGNPTFIDRAAAYTARLDLQPTDSAIGSMFLNGAVFDVTEDLGELQGNLQQNIALFNQFIQQQVYFGHLTDDQDCATFFYKLPGVKSQRNRIVSPTEDRPLWVVDTASVNTALPTIRFGETAMPLSLEILVVGDLDRLSAAATYQAALDSLTDAPLATALKAVHTGAWSSAGVPGLICHTTGGAKTVESSSVPDNFNTTIASGEQFALDGDLVQGCGAAWRQASTFVRQLKLVKDQVAVIVNGRVIVSDSPLQSPAIDALVEYEIEKRVAPAVEAIIDILGPQEDYTALTSAVSTILTAPIGDENLFQRPIVERSMAYRLSRGEHCSFAAGDPENALFEIAMVLDPVSETAQVWSSLAEMWAQREDFAVRVYLNPARHLSEVPIKRFFRLHLEPGLRFGPDGDEVPPELVFEGMPSEALLSLSLATRPSWIVMPKRSVHDLDNIQLSRAPNGVEAVFELESILIEGHARELPGGAPPRGLQLDLKALNGHTVANTIVMANLGYFQLKARPSILSLGIRSGRSAQIYEFAQPPVTGLALPDSLPVALATFEGITLLPAFKKRSGMELQHVIEDLSTSDRQEGGDGGMLSKLKGLWGGNKDKEVGSEKSVTGELTKKQAEINVFTVASGHLYERMAYLMCISVMRHTKSTVKFWFISQFLSPSFRAFIPHLADKYGFEYEMVTYQWPHWLRAQSEKQRRIWGFKILFLDVLFPLELERVIFVDSDQIVRHDLKELIDLKLEKGAPYAYAPMGSDREETKGFRFWESGYWKEALGGKPYHISALYLVDLKQFRRIAAGDQLRGHYHGLSADPNSLANLDQDLPNNMQKILPIHTLDQSWLWCETWCADEGLAKAKTIDLCNNPLTHEPKLARARRLIPEWDIYDREVAALAKEVKEREMRAAGSGATGLGSGAEAVVVDVSELGQAKEQLREFQEHGSEAEKKDQDGAAGEVEEQPARAKDEL